MNKLIVAIVAGLFACAVNAADTNAADTTTSTTSTTTTTVAPMTKAQCDDAKTACNGDADCLTALVAKNPSCK
jgi:hypothetical protein